MKVFKAEDRYLTELDWLKSYHSFSFGEHYHPNNKGWGNLRVINEDYISPGGKFETHPHRDMEIISYIAKGKLHHKDSQGNEYTINENEVQRISAGSGILHSETNPSSNEETILLQLWVKPKVKQTEPNYKQITLDKEGRVNNLQLIASGDGVSGSIDIKQDLKIFACLLDAQKELLYKMQEKKAWIQVLDGQLEVNQVSLNKGDGLAIDSKEELSIKAQSDSHFLLFDINE